MGQRSRAKKASDMMIDRCARCGACLSFCPVFKETLTERFSPRGKNYLINNLLLDEKGQLLKQTLSACLQCGACSERCSSGVDVAALIRVVKNEIGYYRTIPHELFSAWLHLGSKRLSRLIKLAHWLSPMLKEELPKTEIQPFLENPFRNLPIPSIEIEIKRRPGKILFFVGCIQNLFMQEQASRILGLLAKEQEVLVPKQQGCCGLPAYSHGAFKQARKFASRNLEIFEQEGNPVIVTGCASCAYMIKMWPGLFSNDERLYDIANRVAHNTWELSEFLFNSCSISLGRIDGLKRGSILQVPCHQRYGLKSESSLKATMKKLCQEGAYIGELGCCGLGGTFSLTHKGLSMAIFNSNIIERIGIDDTYPQMIATTCSGCLFRLRQCIDRERNPHITACHLVDMFYLS